jgi:hypothetical protein
MNSLPHISHHLFAAAVATEESAPRRPMRKEAAVRTVQGIATVIPLELLSVAEDVPPPATRSLRTVVVAGT